MTTWVFPLAGQSNMVSRADADGTSPWPEGVRFVTQSGETVRPGAVIATPEGNGGPFLIAKCLARDLLAAEPGDDIVFVPGAVGGTSFWNHRWNPGDDLYDNLVDLTRRVLAEHPGGACGRCSSRASRPTRRTPCWPRLSGAASTRFVKAVRADLGAPDLPIVFGELPPAFVDADPRAWPRSATRLALAAGRLPHVADRLEPLAERRRGRRAALFDRGPPRDRRPLRRRARRGGSGCACRGGRPGLIGGLTKPRRDDYAPRAARFAPSAVPAFADRRRPQRMSRYLRLGAPPTGRVITPSSVVATATSG